MLEVCIIIKHKSLICKLLWAILLTDQSEARTGLMDQSGMEVEKGRGQIPTG